MVKMAGVHEYIRASHIQRQTLCIASSTPGLATHAGEDDFTAKIQSHYPPAESNLAERLIHFKQELRKLDSEAFWTKLMEGMTEICHAQYAFVSKRILVDAENAAVEMPPIGEHGSCLMGVALYYNDGSLIKGMHRDYKYFAWSAPCAYMKHDKVFVIPDHLTTFITECPNEFAFEPESYLGVPLFAEGKCYAHFGMMWTKDGMNAKQGLSWTYIEMFMHSLEDMINERLLAGQGFAKSSIQPPSEAAKVIPQSAITVTQSLKPYARSLSHELRTPMQGVVGMLDVMYATVQEQIEGQSSSKLRDIFRSLKNSIEVVQDSSKRAVEAADNVVQAYDLNMQVPDTPSQDLESPANQPSSYFDARPSMGDGHIFNPLKRKRSTEGPWTFGTAMKMANRRMTPTKEAVDSPNSPLSRVIAAAHSSPHRTSPPIFPADSDTVPLAMPKPMMLTPSDLDTIVSTPSFRSSNIREVLPIIINDSLRVGGRPDFAVTQPTDFGERIEVKTRSSNGHSSQKIVCWAVEADVPYLLPIDERDLSKLIGAVFLNAIKFTENGEIDISVRLTQNKRYVLVNVADTGIGIPESFQPELFKPFSQEDDSLTRTREGLGLGLLVAKGLARKIGGDLNLVRSFTSGPEQGSDFEIKFPLEACDLHSRSGTPFRNDTNPPRSTHGPTPTSHLKLTSPLPVDTPMLQKDTSPPFKESSPLEPVSPSRINTSALAPSQKSTATTKTNLLAQNPALKTSRRVSLTPSAKTPVHDRHLAEKHPLSFMVAEDNKINRKLLVSMLHKLGYKEVHEAFDGREAVRVMATLAEARKARDATKRRNSTSLTKPVVDVILMDLWMPEMDGYQATQEIFSMFSEVGDHTPVPPTVLAVSADVTDAAIDRATKIGMQGYMTKPYKLLDLQRLIIEFCAKSTGVQISEEMID